MKYYILSAIIVLLHLTAQASDTLTYARAYNYNVGDTLDYRITGEAQGPNSSGLSINYVRYVIAAKYYAATNDTLFTVRIRTNSLPMLYDTLSIYKLDSLVTIANPEACNAGYVHDIIVDSLYNGRKANKFSAFNTDCSVVLCYAEGLGIIGKHLTYGEPSGMYQTSMKEELVYYNSQGHSYGTPYYQLNGELLLSYTPIPEECATWIRTIKPDPHWGNQVYGYEKVRSGNKVSHNNKVLVEMIYNYKGMDGITSSDSLIGYYSNDTINKLSYLYNSNKVPFYTYNFNKTIGDSIIAIGQVMVGTEQRTIWNIYKSAYGTKFSGYIEGVGGANGICPVKIETFVPGFGAPTITVHGYLTCFSICGQTLYPNVEIAECMLPTAINEIQKDVDVTVFAPVGSKIIEVLCGEDNVKLKLYDNLGRQVFSQNLSKGLENIDIAMLANGMYVYEVANNKGASTTGKLMLQH